MVVEAVLIVFGGGLSRCIDNEDGDVAVSVTESRHKYSVRYWGPFDERAAHLAVEEHGDAVHAISPAGVVQSVLVYD